MELHGEEIEMKHDKGRIVSTRHPPFHMITGKHEFDYYSTSHENLISRQLSNSFICTLFMISFAAKRLMMGANVTAECITVR